MPKIAVEIEWNWPDDLLWLNADNIAIALHDYCTRTKFVVREVNNIQCEWKHYVCGKCQFWNYGTCFLDNSKVETRWFNAQACEHFVERVS